MELQIIPKQDTIPEFDPHAILNRPSKNGQ